MPTYNKINSKLLEVKIQNEQVFSRRGAMVAVKGPVQFAKSFLGPGGFGHAAARSVTGEGMDLMIGQGAGDIYYAHMGKHVLVVPLRGETMYVESKSLLAFDGRLRAGMQFLGSQGVQGMVRGAATGHGMFTTTLEGQGEVAILSDGNGIALEVRPEKPVFVDPQAYLGHVGQVSSQFVTDVNWKTFLGQGSGESFQLKFTGMGRVYIQPSERKS